MRRRTEMRMHVDGRGPNGVRRPEGLPVNERAVAAGSHVERSEAIRARLESGFYDRPEVVARTALLILRSGDLRSTS